MPSPPLTVDETTMRIQDLSWLVGVVLFFVITLGGGWLFSQVVGDDCWREMFIGVWWLPSGVAAWRVTCRVDDHLSRGC